MALVRLGKNAEALPLLEAALPLWKAAGAKHGEADSNGVLGGLYSQTGENRRAIEAVKRASELVRAVGDRESEKNYLESLSTLYGRLGEREKKTAYTFAAFIRPDYDDANVANMLREMGVNQESFGSFPFALELDRLALDYAGDDKELKDDILTNLTDVFIALERFAEAAEIAESQLKLERVMKGGADAAVVWQQLAEINLRTGEKAKAREATEKMLALAASTDNRTTRAIVYNTAGAVYMAAGETEKALPLLKTALVESKAAGVYLVEADAFKNLMLAERALKNDRKQPSRRSARSFDGAQRPAASRFRRRRREDKARAAFDDRARSRRERKICRLRRARRRFELEIARLQFQRKQRKRKSRSRANQATARRRNRRLRAGFETSRNEFCRARRRQRPRAGHRRTARFAKLSARSRRCDAPEIGGDLSARRR